MLMVNDTNHTSESVLYFKILKESAVRAGQQYQPPEPDAAADVLFGRLA